MSKIKLQVWEPEQTTMDIQPPVYIDEWVLCNGCEGQKWCLNG